MELQESYQARRRRVNPGGVKANHKAWRLRHPEKLALCRERAYWKLKMEVLTHYGKGMAVCVHCGETRAGCLSVDHVNDGGNEERRENGIAGGNQFYCWLKRRGFPEGYQTLCMNCQFLKKHAKSFSHLLPKTYLHVTPKEDE
jgi:hypothetical protein